LSSVATLLLEQTDSLAKSSPSARTDAQLLLAHVLARPREWLAAHGEAPVSAEESAVFRTLCERRRTGAPVAYLLGSAWFYGREFIVNESVLIPRPETEHLVDEALRFIRGPMRVLDVGTGCGAIACTIAAETEARVDATDASPAAIDLARENARRMGVVERCRFHVGDLAESVLRERFDVVVANLPYIPTADLPRAPESVSFEPREALDGGADGLELYRRLAHQLPAILNNESLVLLEGAPPTVAGIACLACEALAGFQVAILHDHAGLARYVKAAAPHLSG
jgi:release factor glutamine methyltransferase